MYASASAVAFATACRAAPFGRSANLRVSRASAHCLRDQRGPCATISCRSGCGNFRSATNASFEENRSSGRCAPTSSAAKSWSTSICGPSSSSFQLRRARPISSMCPSICSSAAENRRCRASSCCGSRSEEHTSELQSHSDLVCRLLLEKKKKKKKNNYIKHKEKKKIHTKPKYT